MIGLGSVTFDEHNPNTEKGRENDARASKSGLDYSPLPRLTGKSLAMGCLVSMGGMIFGYDTGQISGFLEMPDFLERFGQLDSNGNYHFSRVRSGLIVSLLSIGTLIGALIAAPIADKFGRRLSISFWSLMTAVGFVIQIASVTAWTQVMMGRFVAGLGVGALSLLVPMYQAETAPAWIRGAMVCAYQLFITMGIFLAACFNFGTYHHQMNNSGSWRIVIGLGWIWTLILGIGILFFPETPRFNYRRGKTEEAVKTLCDVHGAPRNHYIIHIQVAEIESKLHAESKIKMGHMAEFLSMLKAPRMLYRLFLGIGLQSLQQLSGANFFFYYGVSIFKSVNIDSYITQIILNTINFVATFLGLYIVEHFGRRKSLIAGSIWMFVCFLIFASVGHFVLDYNNPERTPTPGIVLIVFAALFIVGFATTWGPMIWTIQAEIFPSRYRAKGMAISTAANWIWNFCIGFFTPFITGAIDYRYGYVFAACNFVAAFVVYFLVIEGQGRTIEEIDTMYLERVTPWKSTEWVRPDDEKMEEIRRKAGIDVEALAAQKDEHSKIAGDPQGGGVRVDGSNMDHVERQT
ncbi:hexose transporter [Beauveria bassiana ARSEF 2860]|uniref:Hexose transporter n=1 Tax=Beauveria bassiana (strain ARSEF 2860) TaxID=655819 RepID=J4WMY0_BEAB2|nr:hexose transporter [Beauveria bassiana ARSEF 2860]EJP71045.1 hexose transporter [Beauveria bassiana ARSEF 2860]